MAFSYNFAEILNNYYSFGLHYLTSQQIFYHQHLTDIKNQEDLKTILNLYSCPKVAKRPIHFHRDKSDMLMCYYLD